MRYPARYGNEALPRPHGLNRDFADGFCTVFGAGAIFHASRGWGGDPMLVNCLAVGAGGFVGSVLRYLIGCAAPTSSFPWATLAINVMGSFALALVAGLALRGAMPDGELSLMLRVGLCGGFTTFSTFSLETVSLASGGTWAGAAAYAAGTVALCVLAALAGGILARA